MTTDKLIAELKLVSWADRKPGMGSMDAIYLDDAIQIIRNHQPEPTQKQVDDVLLNGGAMVAAEKAFEAVLPNAGHQGIKAAHAAVIAYLRQVDNVGGEPQQLSGELLSCPFCGGNAERTTHKPNPEARRSTDQVGRDYIACVGKCKCSMELYGDVDITPIWNTRAALQTPQPATVDNAELEKVRGALNLALQDDRFWGKIDADLMQALAILDKLLGNTINDMEGGE